MNEGEISNILRDFKTQSINSETFPLFCIKIKYNKIYNTILDRKMTAKTINIHEISILEDKLKVTERLLDKLDLEFSLPHNQAKDFKHFLEKSTTTLNIYELCGNEFCFELELLQLNVISLFFKRYTLGYHKQIAYFLKALAENPSHFLPQNSGQEQTKTLSPEKIEDKNRQSVIKIDHKLEQSNMLLRNEVAMLSGNNDLLNRQNFQLKEMVAKIEKEKKSLEEELVRTVRSNIFTQNEHMGGSNQFNQQKGKGFMSVDEFLSSLKKPVIPSPTKEKKNFEEESKKADFSDMLKNKEKEKEIDDDELNFEEMKRMLEKRDKTFEKVKESGVSKELKQVLRGISKKKTQTKISDQRIDFGEHEEEEKNDEVKIREGTKKVSVLGNRTSKNPKDKESKVRSTVTISNNKVLCKNVSTEPDRTIFDVDIVVALEHKISLQKSQISKLSEEIEIKSKLISTRDGDKAAIKKELDQEKLRGLELLKKITTYEQEISLKKKEINDLKMEKAGAEETANNYNLMIEDLLTQLKDTQSSNLSQDDEASKYKLNFLASKQDLIKKGDEIKKLYIEIDSLTKENERLREELKALLQNYEAVKMGHDSLEIEFYNLLQKLKNSQEQGEKFALDFNEIQKKINESKELIKEKATNSTKVLENKNVKNQKKPLMRTTDKKNTKDANIANSNTITEKNNENTDQVIQKNDKSDFNQIMEQSTIITSEKDIPKGNSSFKKQLRSDKSPKEKFGGSPMNMSIISKNTGENEEKNKKKDIDESVKTGTQNERKNVKEETIKFSRKNREKTVEKINERTNEKPTERIIQRSLEKSNEKIPNEKSIEKKKEKTIIQKTDEKNDQKQKEKLINDKPTQQQIAEKEKNNKNPSEKSIEKTLEKTKDTSKNPSEIQNNTMEKFEKKAPKPMDRYPMSARTQEKTLIIEKNKDSKEKTGSFKEIDKNRVNPELSENSLKLKGSDEKIRNNEKALLLNKQQSTQENEVKEEKDIFNIKEVEINNAIKVLQEENEKKLLEQEQQKILLEKTIETQNEQIKNLETKILELMALNQKKIETKKEFDSNIAIHISTQTSFTLENTNTKISNLTENSLKKLSKLSQQKKNNLALLESAYFKENPLMEKFSYNSVKGADNVLLNMNFSKLKELKDVNTTAQDEENNQKYEEIFKLFQKELEFPKKNNENLEIYLGLNQFLKEKKVPNFEEFKEIMQQIYDQHSKCGPKCLHLQRFYEKLGYSESKLNRKPFKIHKRNLSRIITLPSNHSSSEI